MSDIDDLRDEIWRLRTDLRTRARSEANNIYTLTDQVRAIVPVIAGSTLGPAPTDLLYAMPGQFSAGWFGVGGNVVQGQLDTGTMRWYATCGSGGQGTIGGMANASAADSNVIYPTGFAGVATSFTPKPYLTADSVVMAFTTRFPTNGDYTAYGVGASYAGSTDFANGTNDHNVQLLRVSGNWALSTKDGSTRSRTTGGTADGNFHEFQLVWVLGATPTITLYVDNVSTITKTTNLPARPLRPVATGTSVSSFTVDLVDYLIQWEGA